MTGVFAGFMIIYAVGIVLISLKLADIIKNPNKYEETKLVRKAEAQARSKAYFPFFKSLSHQYSMVLLPIWLISILACIGLLIVIYKIKAGAGGFILAGTFLIGELASLFIMIPSLIPCYLSI